jgi:hypothetical protein
MGSMFKSPKAPPPPPPPPPAPREADTAPAGQGAMDDTTQGSSYLASFLSDRKKKDSLGGPPGGGTSFLG